ncbi:MAG: DUF115 domain-containing protein [Defluviitaleaceae bacterium]|nr:DUF115 domain-containing protein [Defluviitaleaceae bacterium]
MNNKGDSKIYQANLKALSNRYPRLLAYATRAETADDDCVVEPAKNGQPTLKLVPEGGGAPVYAHSKYNPENDASAYVGRVGLGADTILLFVGLGMAYHALALLKAMSSQNEFLIYEPDARVFNCLIRNVDIRRLINDERVRLFVGQDTDAAVEALFEDFTMHQFSKVKLEFMPSYEKIFPGLCDRIARVFGERIRIYLVDLNTMRTFAGKWFKNSMGNLRYFRTGYNASAFMGSLTGKPAVVVGAGPSLNKNVHLLKELKGKAVILCAYRALPVLDELGIRPDVVFVNDANQWISTSLKKFEVTDAPFFINAAIVDAEKYMVYPGKKLFGMTTQTSPLTYMLETLGVEAAPFTTGGSVSCITTDFAVQAGCNPIILIGQDLAYTNMEHHAKGTDLWELKLGEYHHRDFVEVDDIYGGKITTDTIMMTVITWFDMYLSALPEGRTVIDATEDGALLQGTKIMTLRDAIDAYCTADTDIADAFDRIFAQGNFLSKEGNTALFKLMQEILDNFEKCLPLFNELIPVTTEYERRLKHVKNPNNITVSRVGARLDALHRKITPLSKHFDLMFTLMVETDRLMSQKKRDDEDETLYQIRMALIKYEGYKEAIEKARPVLEWILLDLMLGAAAGR